MYNLYSITHGDVTVVTDGNGNIFREYVYDPYGNVISVKDGSGIAITDLETDTFNHAYTYAGYRYDAETGLYYLNARYYEAGIGRFLTKDAFKGSADRVKSMNRYAYTHGDPINLIDPIGYDAGAPGMDLGTYTEYQSLGIDPTGSYDSPRRIRAKANNGKTNRESVKSGAIDAGWYAGNLLIEDTIEVLWKRVPSYAGAVVSGITSGFDVSATLDNKNYTGSQKALKIAIQVGGGATNVAFGTAVGYGAVMIWPETGGASIVGGAVAIGYFSYRVNRSQNWLYKKLGLE